MRRPACLMLLLALAALACAQSSYPIYPDRWFFFSRNLSADQHVAEFRALAATAAHNGLNGVMLAASFDNITRQGDAYRRRLAELRSIAAEHGLEIVPLFYSAGYAGGILSHNRNLAEGLPVRQALFVAHGGLARHEPDPEVAIVNGGFEDFEGHNARGYRFHDSPGVISFIDTEVFRSGRASMRFENMAAHPAGNARLMQEIPVEPYRSYRVTAWLKTEDLDPASAFRMLVLTASGRALAPWDARAASTAGWRKLVFGFNSGDNRLIRLYAGVWAGRSGRFWLDDLEIEEVGLLNVLRRDGTPVEIVGEANGVVYEEGRDYFRLFDPQLNFRFDHDPEPIRLTPSTRITEGERLRVNYYHGMAINDGQVTACMSEPETYEIAAANIRLIHELLAPRRYMFSIDEIRAGGTCQACRRRGLTLGEILGDYVTRGVALVREVNPEAEVLAWSDMLDPNHNARAGYYLADGDFSGSWDHVPPELTIVCWYYAKRRESLEFFSNRGFRTLAAAYYDADTLDNPRGWLEALRDTPLSTGIMYTTWQNKYELLGPFGRLVSGLGEE